MRQMGLRSPHKGRCCFREVEVGLTQVPSLGGLGTEGAQVMGMGGEPKAGVKASSRRAPQPTREPPGSRARPTARPPQHRGPGWPGRAGQGVEAARAR